MGKSTLLAALAAQFGRPVFDLDRPDARAAAVSDPGFIVSGPGPVLIASGEPAMKIFTGAGC